MRPLVGDADIRLYDMASGQTSVVTNQLWNEWRPAISGSRVVRQAWATQPDTTWRIQIYGKNLDTGTMPEIPVDTSLSGTQQLPSIFGRGIVFQGDAAGPWHVYLLGISSTTPAASGKAGGLVLVICAALMGDVACDVL